MPYPLSHGGAVAQYFFLERLVNDFDVDFLTIINSDEEKKNMVALQSEIKGLNIFFPNNITFYNSKIKRIFNHFNFFLFRVYNFINNKFNGFQIKQHSFNFGNETFVRFLSNHLRSNSYDICQLEFFETLNLAPLLPKSLKKVFIHHEIKFKKISNTLGTNDEYNKYLIDTTKLFEISLLNEFDKVIVFNSDDMIALAKIANKVELCPFGIPNKLIIKKEYNKDFNFFFFLGSEYHIPNREGLVWFLDNIFIANYEQIKKPIKILGYWSEEFKNKYLNYDYIEFTGFVDSLLVIYQGGVLVAPITSGSGIRTKILESFANKVPVICNSFAAEGLFDDQNTSHLLIFKDDIDFIDLVNSSLKKEKIRNTIAKNAFEYYSKNFNSEILYQKRLNIYKEF